MKKLDAINYFGSSANLIRAINNKTTWPITSGAVSQWGEDVPSGRDFQLEVLSRGALRAPRKPAVELII